MSEFALDPADMHAASADGSDLRAQGRTSREQLLVTRAGRDLDQHRCHDGTEAWFDIGLLRGDRP